MLNAIKILIFSALITCLAFCVIRFFAGSLIAWMLVGGFYLEMLIDEVKQYRLEKRSAAIINGIAKNV